MKSSFNCFNFKMTTFGTLLWTKSMQCFFKSILGEEREVNKRLFKQQNLIYSKINLKLCSDGTTQSFHIGPQVCDK
mgnify:CR=1 FL=1